MEGDAKAQTFAKPAAAFLKWIAKEGRAPLTQIRYVWLLGIQKVGFEKAPITDVKPSHLSRSL